MGANPAFLLKYDTQVKHFDITAIWHEDIEQQGSAQSSFAIPMPKTRRVSVYAEREFGNLGVHFGGLWAGEPLLGREFQLAREENGVTEVFVDEIETMDNFGGKLKLTYQKGKFNWYGQAA